MQSPRTIVRDMRNQVLSVLPQASRDLLDEIERFAAIDVLFASGVEKTRRGGPSYTAWIQDCSATIYIPGKAPTPEGVTHELHHIQRYWNERVPQLKPNFRTEDDLLIAEMIENPLEHMIIIPRDRTIGFPAHEHWNGIERQKWGLYPWPHIEKNPFMRRMEVFSGWLRCMEYVTEQDIVDNAKACIDKEGLLKEAIKFHDDIQANINNKPYAVALFLKVLNLPSEQYNLTTFDICNQRSIIERVPDV